MSTFSQRHGLEPPDAEITVRHDAPPWLRSLVINLSYEVGFEPSKLRSWLCKLLFESPDSNNWSEFPNIDSEVRCLLAGAPWFRVYDLIEWIYSESVGFGASLVSMPESPVYRFADTINRAFRQKGVGWQLIDGKLQVRGPEVFEQFVHKAIELTEKSGRQVARQELKEALADLSRRPAPEITGAIQHSMAALECIARDVTGDPKLTLGDWLKKNSSIFPPSLATAVGNLWGYSSQFGRHVQEGKPADFNDAEMVVGMAGVLSVYLLRKTAPIR